MRVVVRREALSAERRVFDGRERTMGRKTNVRGRGCWWRGRAHCGADWRAPRLGDQTRLLQYLRAQSSGFVYIWYSCACGSTSLSFQTIRQIHKCSWYDTTAKYCGIGSSSAIKSKRSHAQLETPQCCTETIALVDYSIRHIFKSLYPYQSTAWKFCYCVTRTRAVRTGVMCARYGSLTKWQTF
jgi:hypothetical protein